MKYGIYFSEEILKGLIPKETNPEKLSDFVDNLIQMTQIDDDRFKEELFEVMKVISINPNTPDNKIKQLISYSLNLAIYICKSTSKVDFICFIWKIYNNTIINNGVIVEKNLLRYILQKNNLPLEILLDILSQIYYNHDNFRFILMLSYCGRQYEELRKKIHEIDWFTIRQRSRIERLYYAV